MSGRGTARRRLLRTAIAMCCIVALAACSQMRAGGGERKAGSAKLDPVAVGGTLTVGGANFTEMLVMQALYGNLLTKAGFKVTYRSVKDRDTYEPMLRSGEIDVVPEYAATMTEYLNRALNGAHAPVVASSDAQATIAAMRPLAKWRGLQVLNPASATDQNGFAVETSFAQKTGITTLSQFAALGKPVVLAATGTCPQGPFCQLGLQKVYGMRISKLLPTGFGSMETKQAVLSGQASLGLVGTTDGSLQALGLYVLKDDKRLQLADNLVPVINAGSAGSPQVAAALNPLSRLLTSGDLARMNDQVNVGQLSPDQVAKAYLTENGLL